MSIIGDALMGGLEVGRGYLQSDIKAEAESKKADEISARQEATDIRRDDLAQKRMIATEQLKEEFSRSQSQSKYARLQSEGEAIDKEAGNIDFKRSKGLINSIRNSVPNEGEFKNKELSAEDVATIREKMSPADAEKFYGIKPQTALSQTDDQIAAAKNVGAYESRPALIEQRKSLFETDKADRKERSDMDRADRKETKDKEDAALKAREISRRESRDEDKFTTDKMREDSRAEKAQKAATSEKVMTFIDGQRKEVAAESMQLHKQMEADLNNVFEQKDREKIKAAYQPRLDAIAKKHDQITKDFDEIRGRFGLSSTGGNPQSSNGLGSPIGKTPDGRMVYMKNGKKVVGN